MEDFYKEYLSGVIAINVNLTRATLREAQELKHLIDEEIIIQHKKLLLDVSQCEFIDSTFLGVLVYGHKRMITKGGKLNIVEPANVNQSLLHLTRVLESLNIYKTRNEAIENFNSNNPVQLEINNVEFFRN
jgi:anti-anti-sigma factor